MPPRRSAEHLERLGRKPRNGWSGRGLTVAHRPRALVLFFLATVVAGCGSKNGGERPPIPTPIGRGPQFMPAPVGSRPAPSLPCVPGPLPGRIRVHLELFAEQRVVVIPERIGVRPGCRYPLRTLTPTGVIDLDRPRHTLGDFFAVWRMPLSQRRLLTFRGSVTAYVAGRRWQGDVTKIPLNDHGQIVVEIGGYIPPHRFYLFPPR
jgi:hypothetical protein